MEIKASLADGGSGEVLHPGKEMMVFLGRHVIEEAEECVQYESEADPEMPSHRGCHGPEDTAAVRVVDGEAGDDERDHGRRLQPMPDSFVQRV